MKLEFARQCFTQRLPDSSLSLRELTPAEGFKLMVEFYREERVDGCQIEEDGDMLLYQWGIYDPGHGKAFEIDLTRQFIGGAGEDGDIWQLSLTFRYEMDEQLEKAGGGSRWCQSPDEVEEFASFIGGSAALLAVKGRAARDVELEYEAVG